MIADKMSNFEIYSVIFHDKAKLISNFISDYKTGKYPGGRYELADNDLYAIVKTVGLASYEDNEWESHEKYIDMQYVANSGIRFYWTNEFQITDDTSFSEEDDCYTHLIDDKQYVDICTDQFVIFFPQDAHKPDCTSGKYNTADKIVFKILSSAVLGICDSL